MRLRLQDQAKVSSYIYSESAPHMTNYATQELSILPSNPNCDNCEALTNTPSSRDGAELKQAFESGVVIQQQNYITTAIHPIPQQKNYEHNA